MSVMVLEQPAAIAPGFERFSPDLLVYANTDSFGKEKEAETAIYENPDGSSDIRHVVRPAGLPPVVQAAYGLKLGVEPLIPAAANNNNEQWKALRTLPSDIRELPTYTEVNDRGKAIVQALGYSCSGLFYTGGAQTYEAHIPSTDRVNTFLDFLRDKTGFAVNLEDYWGGEFSHEEQDEKLSQEVIMASSLLGIRQHDFLIHIPVYTLLTPELIANMRQKFSNGDYMLYRRADVNVDANLFFETCTPSINLDPNPAKRPICTRLAWLMHGKLEVLDEESDRKNNLVNQAQLLQARFEAVADCAEEFNELALAA